MYKISISASCEKELFKLPKNTLKKIIEAIDSLSSDPLPKGVIKLKGSSDLYRIRKGVHRIIYSLDSKNKTITLLIVRDRKDAYR